VFQCNPAIREVDTSVFCASSPSFLPHVVAQVLLPTRGSRSLALDVPAGSLHVRTLSAPETANVELQESTGLRIDVSPGSIDARAVPKDGGAERIAELVSHLDQPVVVLVERTGTTSDAVFGSTIATFPEFLDLFATEAPASGVELTIAHMALLFSDLTGSTALYGRVGDAKAFGVVQEHFRSMGASVSAHQGAIVKTMGDAVMATFTSELDAIDAALDMLQRCHQEHASLGLSAKLGVHAGPCLAVRANELPMLPVLVRSSDS
jgi:hypothetical protein